MQSYPSDFLNEKVPYPPAQDCPFDSTKEVSLTSGDCRLFGAIAFVVGAFSLVGAYAFKADRWTRVVAGVEPGPTWIARNVVLAEAACGDSLRLGRRQSLTAAKS